MRWLVVTVLVSLACSCGGSGISATEVVVSMSAAGTASSADTVRVRVLGGRHGKPLSEQRVIDLPVDGWPVEFALDPKDGDATRQWRIDAWALRDGTALGAGTLAGTFDANALMKKSLVLKPGVDLGDVPGPTLDGGVDAGAVGSGADATVADASASSNPCDVDNGGCDPRVTCATGRQGVVCGACPAFYEDVHGDGTLCADIDECATDNGGCGDVKCSSCTNKVGAAPVCTALPHTESYFQDVTIAAGSATPAGYQALIDVGGTNSMWTRLAGCSAATGSDVRVTDASGTALPFWTEMLDSKNKHALIWVKLTAALGAGASYAVRLHYGNSSLASASDVGATMDFGDDFRTATSLDSRWQAGDGTAVSHATAFMLDTTNHRLSAMTSGTKVSGRLRSATGFSGSGIVQAKASVDGSCVDGIFATGWDSAVPAEMANGVGILTGHCVTDHAFYGGSWFMPFYEKNGVLARFTVINDGAANVFKRDELVKGAWNNVWTEPGSGAAAFALAGHRVTLGNRYDAATPSAFDNVSIDARWEWIYVRKYVANEPTTSVSDIEQAE